MSIKVAVLAFDGISPFHLSIPCVAFGDGVADPDLYDVTVFAEQATTLSTSAGFGVVITRGVEVLDQADVVIIPSWPDITQLPSQTLCAALCRAYQRGATLVGLCLGAFAIAATGLLNGKTATTHWAYADAMAAQFPAVDVQPDPLYLVHPGLITSAGTAAALDCCLDILRQHYGSELTNQVARKLVSPPYRSGGQQQYVSLPVPASAGDKRINDLLAYLQENLAQSHNIDGLAQRCLMSRRSFTRHFKRATGSGVGEWLLQRRLAYSQSLLESTAHSIAEIAKLAGFGSEVTLRHHFRQRFSTTPSQWRRLFVRA
uniref:GlxA family transcriptional regulator n=1 Tax=Thaumasiovibrio occultus TaxID=1891184 RepID=UPI000B3510C7|nr:helix-turn-helix domain-containing protein [Thaumasiovibrio occultus]